MRFREQPSFVYPFGREPRFDPNHALSRGMRSGKGHSLVSWRGAIGGNKQPYMYDLLHAGQNQYPNLATSGGWSELIGPYGPFTYYVSGVRTTSDIDNQSLVGGTTGMIVYPISLNNAGLAINAMMGTGSTANDFTWQWWGGGGQFWELNCNNNTFAADFFSLTEPSINIPWFIAVSTGVGGSHAFMRRLDTGQLWTGSLSSNLGTYNGQAVSAFAIGCQGNTAWGVPGCYFGAVMYAPQGHSYDEMLEWTFNPYDFWYPPDRKRSYGFAPATDVLMAQILT